MKKLWEKNYKQNEIAQAYCFRDSTVLDNQLVVADVMGSIAHAKMLSTIGILTAGEFIKLKEVLNEILNLEQSGQFKVELDDEDVHTKVENYLIEKLGDLGEKIHTGRSRNDQVLVDLRIYTKKNIFLIAHLGLELADKFTEFAKKYEFVPMPGYTHMQKAMPSSVGMWAGSFAESLIDDVEILKAAFELNNQNPLGSGAAYGVSLSLDRSLTSELLGFSKTQNNSLYCQATRAKGQLILMTVLTQIMLTLSRFAEDVLLFVMSEFDFFHVTPELCTGSSIMPQKKNFDAMEILRAKTHEVIHYEQVVASIVSGLPSGYHADFGETKAPFMKSVEIVIETLSLVNIVLDSIEPNTEILKKACTSELYATHTAYLLVKKGMPFREAYKKVGLSLDQLPDFDAVEVLKSSNHVGGPGNLGLPKISVDIQEKKDWWLKQEAKFNNCLNKLKGGEEDAKQK
ncbi:argininosuccinate lyase [Candidatus Gottesmanbacteria bacterium RBG_13_45_10]|uniref:Argininosuccinate lyase n=1 Tax=Candidatus Gottesmanbacteria bacterium RBG_13_45_10 TaxID=1798370 RepID=A0A1F5ZH07_9BACT|nr:MAG: argininosuccinate lyase [Candidatus Gottesmanbacteria bacterium RBG_13_45_10]